MRVRHITIDDLDALGAMVVEFVKERAAAGDHALPGDRTHAQVLRALAAIGLARTVPGAVLIAEEGETAVGLAAFYVTAVDINSDCSRVARSMLTYVRPEARRQGVARELIARRDAAAQALGADLMQTTTRLENDAMVGLLQHSGYGAVEITFERRLK